MNQFPPIGMSPNVWGPFLWTTMHIVSLGYPATPSQEEKDNAVRFYESLKTMIPCPICQEHYKQILEELPIAAAVKSRDTLINWVFAVHNKVNVQLGKPEKSFDQYVADMRALSSMSHTTIGPSSVFQSSGSNTVAFFTLLAVVGIGGYAVYRYASK